MALLNYTTAKSSNETISDIQRILSQHGVVAVMTEFDGPQVSAVAFKMNVNGRSMGFRLPCNWRAVHEILKGYNANRKRVRKGGYMVIEKKIDDSEAHSVRVAWRIIKDWLEAQMALVEVNMATIPQIFLPYTIMKDDRTLAEHVADDPTFLLGSGN